MVVDFAVEYHPYGAVLVGDGLVTRHEVDDAQAAVAQADRTLHEEPILVRAPVGHEIRHALQVLFQNRVFTSVDSADAAHRSYSRLRCRPQWLARCLRKA